MIIVYTLDNCPNCKTMKKRLKFHRLPFKEEPMDSAASITEMRVNQCFIYEAPVIRVDDEFMTFEQGMQWLDDMWLDPNHLP